MKALLRAVLLVLIAFAIFSGVSSKSNQAFGRVGPHPPSSPCMPPTQGFAPACAK